MVKKTWFDHAGQDAKSLTQSWCQGNHIWKQNK
jgi:hypothetical protein